MAGMLDTKSACKLNAESLSVDKEATEGSKISTLKPLLEQCNPCVVL